VATSRRAAARRRLVAFVNIRRPGATDDSAETTTMKFGLLVSEGPYTHQASDTAYQFAKAALAKGHAVSRVFFYHDGVNNSTKLTEPPQDDRHIVNRWSKLAEEHGIDLVVCVAAALRRGIRDENLAKGFRISGLGQLVEAGIQADRLVVFGD
jgi:tRNA 2-thiouridine synthesizing protein D